MARVGFSTNRHTEHFGGDGGAAGSGTVHDVAEHRGRRVRHRHVRQRQERDLPDPAALPAVRRRACISSPYGINVAAASIAREGYGMPFFEPVESADPLLPEKRVLLVDPRESRLPGVVAARPARREVVHVRQPRAGAVAGPVQRVQLVDGARPSVRRHRDGQHRLQPAAGDHESAAAAFRRAVPVLVVLAALAFCAWALRSTDPPATDASDSVRAILSCTSGYVRSQKLFRSCVVCTGRPFGASR